MRSSIFPSPKFAYVLACACVLGSLAAARAQEAVIGPNAQLSVTVADEPDMTGPYTVDPAGNVTMLYIDSVHVDGLTSAQASAVIKKRLRKYIKDPQVVVHITAPGQIEVTLSGEVTTQGTRQVRMDERLNDLLQQAKPTSDADLRDVQINHGLPGERHWTDDIDYAAYLEQGGDAGNPTLRAGDVIFVKRKTNLPIEVVLRGEVAHPGRFSMPARSTLLDAVYQAGGLTVDGNRNDIQIEDAAGAPRGKADYFTARKSPADPAANPVLHDQDTVTVGEAAHPFQFVILGAVQRPGAFEYSRPGMTMADALGAAGGTVEHAKAKNAMIVRTLPDGTVSKIPFNAGDPVVLKTTPINVGDDIYIPPGSGQRLDALGVIGLAVSVLGVVH